jgi:hypothetical protein
VVINGNIDIYGGVVAKTFSGNGNTGIHYDIALNVLSETSDYRLASYVEDVR